jgi:hypothetical protein
MVDQPTLVKRMSRDGVREKSMHSNIPQTFQEASNPSRVVKLDNQLLAHLPVANQRVRHP